MTQTALVVLILLTAVGWISFLAAALYWTLINHPLWLAAGFIVFFAVALLRVLYDMFSEAHERKI